MKKLLDIKYDINIFKIIVLSLPFFMVYIIDVSNLNILYNLTLLSLFGLYFLFIVWLVIKKDIKNVKTNS